MPSNSDSSEPDWAGSVRTALAGRTVTVSMDGVGGPLGRTALELVGLGGRILFYGWASGEPGTAKTSRPCSAARRAVSRSARRPISC